MPRSGVASGREEMLASTYESESIETLLRMAARRSSWPWDCASSFSDSAIADAVASSRVRVGLLCDVRPPLWRKLWPIGRDRLSIMSQPIPGGDAWTGHLVTIVSSSDRIGPLLVNLSRALEIAGGDSDQLVTSMEHRERERGSYHHVIACIPGSR